MDRKLLTRMTLPLALTAVLLIAGCSGMNKNGADGSYLYAAAESPDYYATTVVYRNEKAVEYEYAGAPAAAYDTGGANTYPEYESKIIRDAEMTVKADDAAEAYAEILAYAKARGGYEFAHNTYRSDYGDQYTIYATVKIEPKSLDGLIAHINELFEVTRSSASSKNITESYYDAKTRLDTLRRSLDKYYEFLSSSKNVTEMLQVQNQIDRVIMEIESYEGRLRMWDALTDEATLTLTIYQNAPDVKEPRVITFSALTLDDMGYLLSSGFMGICGTILSFFQWAVIIVAAASPILVPAAVVAVILVRRGKKKRAAAQAANAALRDGGS